MARKGQIQIGTDSDLTIFVPDTVTDEATPEQGGLPSTGNRCVMINGTVVVANSKVLKGINPGRPIRAEVS